MKKSLVMIAVLGMLSVVSCNKDKEEVKVTTQNADHTTPKILAFETKVNQGAKNDVTYDIDSAVWYIEGLLNYTYCMHTEEDPTVSDQEIVNFALPIITNNEQISLEVISEAYNVAAAHIQKDFTACTANVKDLLAVDANYKNDTLFFTTLIGVNKVDCKACTHPDINIHTPFTAVWYYDGTYSGGICTTHECHGWGVNNLITRKFNGRQPLFYGYYTDIKSIKLRYDTDIHSPGRFPNPNSNDPNFCNEYLLIEGGLYDFHNTYSECLTAEESNFYLNSAYKVDSILRAHNAELGDNYINDQYGLIRIKITAGMFLGKEDDNTAAIPYPVFFHDGFYWYGKPTPFADITDPQ